jgi:SAM-dependent methyltransferase
MLERASQHAAAAEGLDITFRHADAMTLPFRPRSFNVITGSLVAYLLPDPAAALERWRALLRPGGVLAFTWVLSDDPAMLPAYQAVDALVPAGRQTWTEFTTRPPWDSLASVEAMLSGYAAATTTIEPVTTRYDSPDHWWRSNWSQGPALCWKQIPEHHRAAARFAAMRALDPLRAEDGTLTRVRQVCYTVARL